MQYLTRHAFRGLPQRFVGQKKGMFKGSVQYNRYAKTQSRLLLTIKSNEHSSYSGRRNLTSMYLEYETFFTNEVIRNSSPFK